MDDHDTKNNNSLTSPWYKKGLCFSCKKCGQCCTGFPGFVWLSPKDLSDIANFLQMSQEMVLEKFTRKVFHKISLIEILPSYDCIFFCNNRCSIYPARPVQCRTFPFWPHLLLSKETWDDAARSCPGMQTDENMVPYEEIEKKLQEYQQNFLP
ncbi:MAG: YkgJ family cysteine cluster protein [Parachlamydiales bacterium]|nr:YkgJ family cysteine cluster protein [Parachlamydiales bacterium]